MIMIMTLTTFVGFYQNISLNVFTAMGLEKLYKENSVKIFRHTGILIATLSS